MNNIEKILGSKTYKELLNMKVYTRCVYLIDYLFQDKKDKCDKPYIHHLSRVSINMSTFGIEGVLAGLLHDIVEDIEVVTFYDLKDFGIPNSVINAIKLVTNEKDDKILTKEEKLCKYNKKIDKIIDSGNELAINLKYCDMKDNYDSERLKNLSPELQEWFKLKYENNLKKISDAIYNMNIKKTLLKVKGRDYNNDRY